MDMWQALVLGIVQGLTEFLPISSSGHLVLFQNLFGLKEPEILFDVMLHVGTLAAVVFFYRKDLIRMFEALLRVFRDRRRTAPVFEDPDVRLAGLIVLGSIPTAMIGLGMNRMVESLFSSVFLVGCALLVTGGLLWATRWRHANFRDVGHMNAYHALVIGGVQGVAIIPGISRSGATISAALFMGIDKEVAARYSFLLSVPAIIGAALLTFLDAETTGGLHPGTLAAGFFAALVSGYLALKLLVFIVQKGRIHLFSPYCWLIGLVALWLGL